MLLVYHWDCIHFKINLVYKRALYEENCLYYRQNNDHIISKSETLENWFTFYSLFSHLKSFIRLIHKRIATEYISIFLKGFELLFHDNV